MSKLKPCPFCGGEASSRKTYKGTYNVSCNRLCVGQYVYETEEEAINAWNNRKPIDLIKKEISALADVDGNAYLDCADIIEIIEKIEGGD